MVNRLKEIVRDNNSPDDFATVFLHFLVNSSDDIAIDSGFAHRHFQ